MEPTKEPDEGIDPLLAAEAEGDAQRWRSDPWTARMVKAQQRRYVALTKELQRMSVTSTDAKLAAKGAQIQELTSIILTMGGKV